jgi:formate hydrogenlyase subunit 6/NADH:ubiquinone oxidoreductase subunit I
VETTTVAADFLPQIDASKCIGCEICVKQCPHAALGFADNIAFVARPEACDYTGVCQEICPTEAITLTYEIILPDN